MRERRTIWRGEAVEMTDTKKPEEYEAVMQEGGTSGETTRPRTGRYLVVKEKAKTDSKLNKKKADYYV